VRLMPQSLFGRLTLILVIGLLAAQFASLWLHIDEREMLLQHGAPHIAGLPSRFWIHLTLTLTAVIAVSVIAVRLVTRPIQRLADAADAFGRNLDSPPLEETGPTETRLAAEAFNRMQARLQRLIVERSRALAAVSHDLRTPLTRMRLRAELVEDEALRGRSTPTSTTCRQWWNPPWITCAACARTNRFKPSTSRRCCNSMAIDEQALGRPVVLGDIQSAPYLGRMTAIKACRRQSDRQCRQVWP